jgi:hypothetical protein
MQTQPTTDPRLVSDLAVVKVALERGELQPTEAQMISDEAVARFRERQAKRADLFTSNV